MAADILMWQKTPGTMMPLSMSASLYTQIIAERQRSAGTYLKCWDPFLGTVRLYFRVINGVGAVHGTSLDAGDGIGR